MDMITTRRERLCLFTRYPEPGTTKTRLIPVLGKKGAADLQRRMTVHTLEKVRRLAARRKVDVEVRYEGGDERRMKQWLGTDLVVAAQGTGDIGRRMARAFHTALADGFDTTVIIGSDIPGITTDILARAFGWLEQKDLVFGPARDGGYYLIGIRADCLKKAASDLFSHIDWGTGTVLAETLRVVDALGLSYSLLNVLGDVDWPADIPRWEKALKDTD
jgi:rSAM/selenodomain-associated transferase 1